MGRSDSREQVLNIIFASSGNFHKIESFEDLFSKMNPNDVWWMRQVPKVWMYPGVMNRNDSRILCL